MPITPLHLAIGLPARKYVSIKAFILANVLIDLEPGLIMFFGMDSLGYRLHQGMHTFGGATLACVGTLLISMAWKGKAVPKLYGAALGAYSHILLDALVHWDVELFEPFMEGNPLLLNIEPWVALTCASVLIYYLVIWVESLRVSEVALPWLKNTWRKFFPSSLGK